MFFGQFFASFSKNWHKNVAKFPFRMSKNLFKVFPTSLQNFFIISLKLERNIFNILRNFRKINNLKLPRCFSIIFLELIQNLFFLHFFWSFQEISWKYSKQFHKIISKMFSEFPTFLPKFSASIPKYVFRKSPNVHIFSKFFKRWNGKRACRHIISKW